ncbi:MAG: sigma-E factor regulatory protein RseB domain-containing protein [Capsulimonadaceae bacterium]
MSLSSVRQRCPGTLLSVLALIEPAMPTGWRRVRLAATVVRLVGVYAVAGLQPGFALPPVQTAGGPHAASKQTATPDPAQLYARSLTAESQYSYSGHRTTIYWRTGRTLRVFIRHLSPSRRRIDYLSPDSTRGRVLVSDGRDEWQYSAVKGLLRHYRLPSKGADRALATETYRQLKANYILKTLPGTCSFANRKAYVLVVTREKDHTPARRLWIDADTGLVLKREDYSEKGLLNLTIAFSDINYHPGLTPASFQLPGMKEGSPGVRVEDAQPAPEERIPVRAGAALLGGKALAPERLEGYRLTGAAVVRSRTGIPVLHLRYSDGLVLISVFEFVRQHTTLPTVVPSSMSPITIRGRTAHETRHAALATLNFDTPVLNITVMGEVAPARLYQIATVLDPRAARVAPPVPIPAAKPPAVRHIFR